MARAKHGSREELWAARMSLHATLDIYTWIRHAWENRDSPGISRNRVFCNTLSNKRNRNLSLEAGLMDNGSSLRNVQGWWSSFLLAPSTAEIITTQVKFLLLSFLPQPTTTHPLPCVRPVSWFLLTQRPLPRGLCSFTSPPATVYPFCLLSVGLGFHSHSQAPKSQLQRESDWSTGQQTHLPWSN